MRRSLAAFAAATLLASSMPAIGFAEESTADPTTETTEASVSSTRPCDDLKGLRKAQCIAKHRPKKHADNDRVKRQNNRAVLDLLVRCKELEGAERIRCMRLHGKAVKKVVRKAIIRTVRGKPVETSSEGSED